MFDLARLRLLRDLARRGTMTAVAEALGQTSSAVSQQLAVLEREAGTILFERVGRRVRLTGEGERLAAHAETILAAVEAARLDLRAGADEARGTLTVASFPSFAKARLLPALVRLRRRHPALDVALLELEPPDALDALRDGRCDLAVDFTYSLVPMPPLEGVAAHPVLDEPLRLILPSGLAHAPEPLDPAFLADADWIVGSRQADDRSLAERLCAPAGFAPRLAHRVDDYDWMLRMVAAGLGVGLAPQLALELAGPMDVAIRTPAGPPLTRRIRMLARPAMAASPAVQGLLSELAAAG
jgi:DNA-binding transcriptional LysR family regulator